MIEHVNGMLKGSFRCLHGHRVLHYDPIRAAKIIYTWAVLHNMGRTYNVPTPVDAQLPPPQIAVYPPQLKPTTGFPRDAEFATI